MSTTCIFCKGAVQSGQAAASVVGGFFVPEPDVTDMADFFAVDEDIFAESYMHLECLYKALHPPKEEGVVES